MAIPKKSCPAILDCEECCWYREWDWSNKLTGEKKREWKCSIEVLLEYIPKVEGSIDGCQAAANIARNEAVKTQGMIQNLGVALGNAFSVLETKMDTISHENYLPGSNNSSNLLT